MSDPEDKPPAPPPTPETLLHAILTLHEKVRTGEITTRRHETGAGAGLHVEPQPAGLTPVTLGR
jgi:NADH-quinone oxidoreductase subunit B